MSNESSHYSNNENGYLVLYPEDDNARLKLWGSCQLYSGDTLFIYNGVYDPNNPASASLDTIAVGSSSWTEDNPVFLAWNAGDPISIRFQSDNSCTNEGIVLYAKCCGNTALPENLQLRMLSDSCARLSWNPGEGTEISYNWTLYDTITHTEITHGTTTGTSVTVCGLDANIKYYFTISMRSECSNEETQDVVVSDTNKYVYGLGIEGNAVPGEGNLDHNVFGNGEIHGSINTTIDSAGNTHAELRICEGNAAHICFTMPENLLDGENINVRSTLRWETNMQPRSFDNSNDYYYQEGDHYVIIMQTNGTRGCWTTEELYENGYANVVATTENGSTAQAFTNIIIDTLPNIQITIDDSLTDHQAICMYNDVLLKAKGGNTGFRSYCWQDSLNEIRDPRKFDTF